MNTHNTLPSFATQQQAIDWMCDTVDDPFIDNVRFAFAEDHIAVAKYDEQVKDGCCGSFDQAIIVDGRAALIGCNYGH